MMALSDTGSGMKRGNRDDIVMGEDWVDPASSSTRDDAAEGGARPRFLLRKSPLARKIIVFNLMALVVLVAGVLFLNPFRDSLASQREDAFVREAHLIADVIEARLTVDASGDQGRTVRIEGSAAQIAISPGAQMLVYSPDGVLMARARGPEFDAESGSNYITGFLSSLWESVASTFAKENGNGVTDPEIVARSMLPNALKGEAVVSTQSGVNGQFSVAVPVMQDGQVVAALALIGAAGEIDRLVGDEREQILQMFLLTLVVSIGLSLVLASTIATPISDLAAAAEISDTPSNARRQPARIRIPDLTARPDEIGRLSIALRGMVAALYDRIDSNEQFAADVSHEIKNPLASLRSAVASMHLAKRDDQRTRLLEVIEHDVRRLDRLVSDISNASRLDSELVKEQEEEFNLSKTLTNLCEYLGEQAREKGVELITDFPADPIRLSGLEARLAQVFVNLISNAISFCEDGDAVRVWARRKENRILVVVEDTGPGIPEVALTKIFKRFYSERPKNQFGNNSGLGLSISKQIVEAHGGVIWAENIRPTDADPTSEPLGARFVVGLPV